MKDAPRDQTATRALLAAACFTIVVAGMKAAASILVPFLLAVFIAVISAPLFLALQRKGVPAAIALLLLILILAAIGLVGVAVVRASLSGFVGNLPKYQDRLQGQMRQAELWLEKRIGPLDQTATDAWNPQVAMRYVGTAATSLSNVLSQAFLILIVVIFILLETAILPAKVRALPGMTDATWGRLQRIVDETRRYMSMKTAISLLTGVLVAVWTAALGVDYPILLGLLAFVLNYVPTIGSIIAAVPGVLLALVEFGLGWATITAAGYLAVNVGVSNFIEPRVMGRGLGLSPLVILLSMIFWGWVLGPIGMLLSVPLTMTAKIALENSEETRWIALLMGTKRPKQPRLETNRQACGSPAQGSNDAKG